MFVREGSRRNEPDLISQAIGSPRYLQPWYPEDLTLKIYGRKSPEPVRISRWYFDERIAVDFEPDPRDEKFYIDEKRRWCRENRIVYVPVYLADQLTLDQFAERLSEAHEALRVDWNTENDQKLLDAASPEAKLLQDEGVKLYVDREALRRVEEGVAAGNNWRGFAKQAKLVTFKREIVAELLRRFPSGAVGPEYRAHVAPSPAGGSSDR